eukprot:3801668-Prymnesium_polylepis.1
MGTRSRTGSLLAASSRRASSQLPSQAPSQAPSQVPAAGCLAAGCVAPSARCVAAAGCVAGAPPLADASALECGAAAAVEGVASPGACAMELAEQPPSVPPLEGGANGGGVEARGDAAQR